MDNPANSNAQGGGSPDKPATPQDGTAANQTPAGTSPAVSRAPLNLGGTSPGPATPGPAPQAPAAHTPVTPNPAAHSPAAPSPAATHSPAPQAPAKRPLPASPVAALARTTSCKTFFTKLHPGAINFLDEQITKWIKENPNVVVKHTNVTTGDVQDKKTEPNIIVTIWY